MRPLLLSLLLLLTGCSMIPVSVDYQPGYDFSQVGHYYWVPTPADRSPASIYNSSLVSARVEQAVENELLRRGILRTTNREEADILVRYQIGIEKMVDLDFFMLEGSFSRHRGHNGLGLLGGQSQEYKEATLVIDLLDPAERRLLWRGVAERRLSGFKNPVEHDTFIAETVAAVLQRYPPQP